MAGFPGWKEERVTHYTNTCPDDERRCRAPTLCADDLHVEMSQPAGHGQSEDHHALHRHGVPVQVVVQRAVLVVL